MAGVWGQRPQEKGVGRNAVRAGGKAFPLIAPQAAEVLYWFYAFI
ncbi:hypothetical protein AGMMS49546_03250 [Spirochaetia bacterium]|nr:hypothetical protein AGMMS49546_03250 [Spirochaetia bacterium]